jgi:hypothetical protein
MGADVRFGSARWARLAVALVNTAPYERQEDLLISADQLRELLLAHDEPGPVEVGDRDLADARQARDALAAVFSWPVRRSRGWSGTRVSPCICTWTRRGPPGAAGWPRPAPWAWRC